MNFTQRSAIQKPAPVTPKGFVKVTNRRKGEFILPVPPFVIPPGVSYHDEKIFNEMHENVQNALVAHLQDGDLEFQSADVAPPPEAPPRFVPQAQAPAGEAPAVLPLSEDPAQAFAQIAAETNVAVLSAWFEARPIVDVSDAILARLTVLNPS